MMLNEPDLIPHMLPRVAAQERQLVCTFNGQNITDECFVYGEGFYRDPQIWHIPLPDVLGRDALAVPFGMYWRGHEVCITEGAPLGYAVWKEGEQ